VRKSFAGWQVLDRNEMARGGARKTAAGVAPSVLVRASLLPAVHRNSRIVD